VQLEAVVNRLLQKLSDRRFQSAAELRDALAAVSRPSRRWQRLFGRR
jgi:hypothetical protein